MPLSALQFHTSTHPSVANCPLSGQPQRELSPARHPLVLPWGCAYSLPRAPSDRTRGFSSRRRRPKPTLRGGAPSVHFVGVPATPMPYARTARLQRGK